MNYDKMSDYEINKRVAEIIYPNIQFTRYKPNLPHAWKKDEKGNKYIRVNYCNNPLEAWPLVERCLITLGPKALFVGGNTWFAMAEVNGVIYRHLDLKPMRAAMIVFLMMQESANAA